MSPGRGVSINSPFWPDASAHVEVDAVEREMADEQRWLASFADDYPRRIREYGPDGEFEGTYEDGER